MRRYLVVLGILFCSIMPVHGASSAGEVNSPEQFLMAAYGWTIKGLDNEHGWFGDFRAFACFDDRLGPPKSPDESVKRRWGTQCQTKRARGENLGAMIFLSWVNPKHPKPQRASDIFEFDARQMAGSAVEDQGSEAKCGAPEQVDRIGKAIAIYDCAMVLPFGTYYASFVQFQHRDIEYFIRIRNASSAPIPDVPSRTARKIASVLTFG